MYTSKNLHETITHPNHQWKHCISIDQAVQWVLNTKGDTTLTVAVADTIVHTVNEAVCSIENAIERKDLLQKKFDLMVKWKDSRGMVKSLIDMNNAIMKADEHVATLCERYFQILGDSLANIPKDELVRSLNDDDTTERTTNNNSADDSVGGPERVDAGGYQERGCYN